ncbi:MAG TPA: LD-carboxypeptidase [Gemmatimonadales bacterium]|nr:LD-carboxypeptidase [Gemmatimonadales bacterium]
MGSKTVIRPPRLRAGSRVALLAPSGPLSERDDLTRALELCRAFQFEPIAGTHALERHGYLAGEDDARLADLNQALNDPSVDAIWCLRGGYGVTRILDRVETEGFVRRPKVVIGFSDVTALLLALHESAGVVTYHGPMSRSPLSLFSRRHFELVLTRVGAPGLMGNPPTPSGVTVPRAPRIVALHPGVAEGPLVGGNLTLLMALAGTRHFPDLTGALLFLEDVGEDLYRIDRHLAHLRMLGALDRLAGVIAGQFTEMRRGTGDGGALALDEVLGTYLTPLGIPVAMGFPIGHIEDQWTLPIGVRARLDAGAGEVEILDECTI